MWKLVLALFLIGLPAQAEQVVLSRVLDGDTVEVRTLAKKPQKFKVRLVCIDSPELKQPGGPEAKAFMELFIENYITLDGRRKDLYNRRLCKVSWGNYCLNEELVRQGHAWAYMCPDYLELEQQAREAKIGLWQDAEPTRPSEFRKASRNKKKILSPLGLDY